MMYNNSQVVNQALMIGMNMGMKIGGEIAQLRSRRPRSIGILRLCSFAAFLHRH